MKKQALFCMVLAGTLIVGGCGQKAADSTAATAQVTETSDSAPPDGDQGILDGKQAPPDGGNGGPGDPGGQNAAPTSYTAVSSYSTDTEEDGKTYTSTGADESAVLVTDGANVTLKNFTMDRNSADSTGGDNSSFYGTGAAALATNGSLTLTGGTITTDAKGGAGVFSYGNGKVTVSFLSQTALSPETFRKMNRMTATGPSSSIRACPVTQKSAKANFPWTAAA